MSAFKKSNIPVVTLKDMVVFPQGVQPLFIGTPKSIKALNVATSSENSEGKKRSPITSEEKVNQTEPSS
jgi:ATP-dependent Lon protease